MPYCKKKHHLNGQCENVLNNWKTLEMIEKRRGKFCSEKDDGGSLRDVEK